MRAELSRKFLFVVAAVDRDGLKTHLSRVLNTEMAESADAVNGDDVSSTRTRVAQRVVDRNARTHEWSCFFRRNLIRNRSQHGGWCNQVLGISTIEVDPGDFSIDTHREVASPALFTHEAVAAMPADTNALTSGPCCDVVAYGIDKSGDFMTRH